MKLKNNIYRDMLSVLVSNQKEFRSQQTIALFSRALSEYPSKSDEYLAAHRVISYMERSINSISLIIDSMTDEGEDQELIDVIEQLNREPTITTKQEVDHLCQILGDYIRYSRVLKVKNSFIQSFDMLEDDDNVNIRETVDTVYNLANAVSNAYNVANVSAVSHTFDTNDTEAMELVVAEAQEARAPDRVILTGIRYLNTLLSPGYLPGCLYVYAALPGNYKSGILLESHVDTCRFNEHIKATTNGKIPISIYISMENSMAQTIRRLWGILYPGADMSMYSAKEVTEMINNVLTEKGMRSVILYYGYREKSTADLANIIRSYNDEKHQVVAVYFDYIKRIRPARTDAAATSSEKAELNAIMNELKLITIQFDLPIVTGHQLNRMAQQAIDSLVQNGGYDKSNEVLNRSQIGSAFEVVEVADWLGLMQIENHRDNKTLMVKAAKQRDKDGRDNEVFTAIRHPFLSMDSFALKTDLNEKVPMSEPLYQGKQHTNFMNANI
jgi:replicative DNA helicase